MATRKRLERSLAWFWINCKLGWQPKQSQMKCNFWSSVKTCIDWTSFDFRFRNLLSNLPLNIIIYCVTTQPSITRSRRSVLNFQLSVLTFQWPSQRTLCKEKNISTPISVQCDNKRLLSRFLIHFIWPRYSTWPMQEWQNPAHEKNCLRLQNITISSYIHFFLLIDKNLWRSREGESQWVGRHEFKSLRAL